MKLRIVQDLDAFTQPWYRLEHYIPAADSWHIITSGSDHDKVKERFNRVIERRLVENEVLVLEEKDI